MRAFGRGVDPERFFAHAHGLRLGNIHGLPLKNESARQGHFFQRNDIARTGLQGFLGGKFHGAVIDKAHGAATQAVLQAFFHLFDQAFGNIIVEAQFGVAHHLEGVCRDVVVIEHEKNVVQAQANDVIHKDDVVAAGGRRHFHKPGAGGVDRNAQHRIPAFSRCGGGFHFDGMLAASRQLSAHMHYRHSSPVLKVCTENVTFGSK